jgi:methionine-gamma-lyase
MGAINAVLLALLRAGDHVIAQRCLYGGTFSVFASLASRYGIDVSYITGRDSAELTAALRPESRLLFLETIANPTIAVADLPALLTAGRAAGLTCVVDNTFATPVLCRPIEHGADIVVHSATKYLGGHDDVTLGLVVSASREMHRALWKSSVDLGVAADPFAAWLTVRGLKTLALRMGRHCANAAFLAERLVAHPAVAAVHWPGLAGHPDHATAGRLLSGYGGMVAFDVAGGREAGLRFITALPRASARGASASRSGWNTPKISGRTSSRPLPPPRHDHSGAQGAWAGSPRSRAGGRASRVSWMASRPVASARLASHRAAACWGAARAVVPRCEGRRDRGWSRAA